MAATLFRNPAGRAMTDPAPARWLEDMRPFNEELKARREISGLDERRVAQVLGLTPMSYFDLEFHPDEWENVTPFYVVRFVCRWFELDFLDFVSATPGEKLTRPAAAHAIIRQQRQAKRLSETAFADACGFYPIFTTVVESDDGIVLYPFQVSRMVWRRPFTSCGCAQGRVRRLSR